MSDLHFSGFMQGKSGPFSSVSSLAVNCYCIFFTYRLKPIASVLFPYLAFGLYIFLLTLSTLYNQAHLQPVILGKSFSLSFLGSKLSEVCNNCCFVYGGYSGDHS